MLSITLSMFAKKPSGVWGIEYVFPIPKPLSADSWREWSAIPDKNGSSGSSVLLARSINSCCTQKTRSNNTNCLY